MKNSPNAKSHAIRSSTASLVVLSVLLNLVCLSPVAAAPTRSTTIALTSDEQRLVVVNREADSVSIIRVKNANGNDVANKIAEIGVGEEPRSVAVSPDDRFAFVTNAISGTVSVVNLRQNRVVKEMNMGTEPRSCALTADGSLLDVANHTEGTVSIIDTGSLTVAGAVRVGGRPFALAITDRGTGQISDDVAFVTEIFAELNPDFQDPNFDGNGEARDLGQKGVVHAFPAITKITLKSLANAGFIANRTAPNNFCNMSGTEQSPIFCATPHSRRAAVAPSDARLTTALDYDIANIKFPLNRQRCRFPELISGLQFLSSSS